MIEWFPVRAPLSRNVTDFVAAHEYTAVYIGEWIRLHGTAHDAHANRGGNPFRTVGDKLLVGIRAHTIVAVMLASASGILYAAWDPHYRKEIADSLAREHLFRKIAQRTTVILGEYTCVCHLENYITNRGRRGCTAIDYHQLTARRNGRAPEHAAHNHSSLNKYQVMSADQSMFENIFPLQQAYLFEEVLVDRASYNAKQARKQLLAALAEQVTFVLFDNQTLVSKVSTNARGLATDQIGGLYTLPDYRRRGIARYLMTVLLQKIFQTKEQAALFVKQNNRAAINLYSSMGFVHRGNLRISYIR